MTALVQQVNTLAGNGRASCVDSHGVTAGFNYPFGICYDREHRYVIVADAGNQRIRKIDLNSCECSTLAGDDGHDYVDGRREIARFNNPLGVAVDPETGDIIVADSNNFRIRRVSRNGNVRTVAGAGIAGFADSTDPSAAWFNNPIGVAVDLDGNIIIADSNNQRIRKICATTSAVTTIAGTGSPDYVDGSTARACFNTPVGCAVDNCGNIFVADFLNHCVRKISPGADGQGYVVSTLAGNGRAGSSLGNGDQSCFNYPIAVAIDGDANVLVADRDNHRICLVKPDGHVSVLAGNGAPGYSDGPLNRSRFNTPRGLVVDEAGNVIVADYSNHRIRVVRAGLSPPHQSQPGRLACTPSTFQSDMASLLSSGLCADVVFNVSGERIPAHSCILQARSAYFHSMLCSGFKEGSSKDDIVVKDTTPAAFRAVLKYIYTDQIDEMEEETVFDVMTLAQFYQMDHLFLCCLQQSESRISVPNAVRQLVSAHARGIEEARQSAMRFLRRNFRRVKAEAKDSLAQLSEHPELMLEILTEVM